MPDDENTEPDNTDDNEENSDEEYQDPDMIEEVVIGSGGGPNPSANLRIFVNPSGEGVWFGRFPPCPLIIMVTANEFATVKADKCDKNYDFSQLEQQAKTRVFNYVQQYQCPAGCPTKEFFQNPSEVENWTKYCWRMKGGTVMYGYHYNFFFACNAST